MKDSLYEQNFKLHSENARLRKKIEQLESSLGFEKLNKKNLTVIINFGKRPSPSYATKAMSLNS